MAVAVVRLARRRAIVQELPAVEGLARADVVCFDKTGTLTEGTIRVERVQLLDDQAFEAGVACALATLAKLGDESNPSIVAIRAAYHDEGWPVLRQVPFSSARKWSAIATEAHGSWFLGAHEVVGRGHPEAQKQAEREAAAGFRVLMLADSSAQLVNQNLPTSLEPVALVLLAEQIRPDARQTLEYFAKQGIAVKVISGDHPSTLAVVASQVNINSATSPVDGRALPQDGADLSRLVEEHVVFGRIAPSQKRDIVAALKSRGHVVAMVGDGVNDVLALKKADIGIAMASGSAATRAVAQVVLLANEFSALPAVISEGRRVIANIERLANLFITKTVYAFLLAMAIGIMAFPFPFLPRHLTLVGSLSIGIPAFFLALAPNAKRARSGFVNRVLRFSIPAGFVAAAATFAAYTLVLDSPYASFAEAQTMATMVLVGTGLWLLSVLARPFAPWKTALVAIMIAAFVLILATPITRRFFALDVPSVLVSLAALGIVALAGAAIELGWHVSNWKASGGR
jgi:cation-transporting ATPase E